MPNKAKRLFLVVCAAALAGSVFGQGKLTGVQWKKVGEGVELEIQGQDLAKPKTIWTNNHRSFLLEFDANLSGKAGTQKINSNGVRHVSYGWYQAKPPKVRVHVNLLKNDFKPEVFEGPNGWWVAFGQSETAARFTAKAGTRADAFPESVPPLDKPLPNDNMLAKLAASPVKALPPTKNVNPFERKVSLTFEATDIVQILKALALQADVNIVTAPEVKGQLSVALNDVNVQQALDFVTTLAGVRYALVGNTFVVTTNERFANAMRSIYNKPDEVSQTRIITLQSGEGAQIKATVMKAVPQETVLGRYDILLPTEVLEIESKKTQMNAEGGKSGGNGGNANVAGGGESNATEITSKSETGSSLTARPKDMYVVLIGLPKRLEEVEKVVREVDNRIAEASKIVIGKDISTCVIPVYSSRISEVANAVRRVVDRDPKRELYNIQESDTGQTTSEEPLRLLVISGPQESLKNVETFARAIDEGLCKSMGVDYPESQEDQTRAYEVFDLKYVEPLEAAVELQNRVQGLRATVLPAPVSPMPRGSRTVSQGSGADSGSSSGAGGGSGSSTSSSIGSGPNAVTGKMGDQGNSASGINTSSGSGAGSSSGSSSAQDNGYSLTKNLGSEPMKLLVRGTRSQINQAREYLNMFDLPPRQVALELRVMEITKEDAQRIGLDWSVLTGGVVRSIRINQSGGSPAGSPGTVSSGIPGSTLSGDQGIKWPGGTESSVTATLDEIAGSVKLVARPNIIASEGRPTTIFIGDEIRYVESIQASQNGITVTTGQVNVGVKFVVTPRVGAGGNLTLDLNPELSLLKGFVQVPGGGQLPQTSLRSTQSIVNVKSGETLAIGGLIQDLDRSTVSGVPILKDIPLLGYLFKRTDRSKSRSEIVFFLTAKVVGDNDRESAADPRASERAIKPEIDNKKKGSKGN